MNLLDTDQFLLDMIFNDFPNAHSHQWESDGSLELFDEAGTILARLSLDQVDKYISNLLSEEINDSIDKDDGDYYIEDENF
jgi:hypothetical protein